MVEGKRTSRPGFGSMSRIGGRSRPSSLTSPIESQPSCAAPPMRRLGQRRIKGRAEPAGGVDVIDVKAGAGEADRPGAGKADRRAPREQGRMPCVRRRQPGDMALHRLDDRRAQRADLGLDPAEQRPVGLRAAAQRLFERVMLGKMQAAQALGERVERGNSVRQCRRRRSAARRLPAIASGDRR